MHFGWGKDGMGVNSIIPASGTILSCRALFSSSIGKFTKQTHIIKITVTRQKLYLLLLSNDRL